MSVDTYKAQRSAISLQAVDGADGGFAAPTGGSETAPLGERFLNNAPEPMSADTYKDIMTDLGRINQSLHPDVRIRRAPQDEVVELHRYTAGEDQFSAQELAMRQDMSMNKAVWCGEFRRDMWYFLININPFLAACYSHPLHPISRCERYVVYLMSLVLVTNISAAIALASLCDDCGYLSCGHPAQLDCSHVDAGNLVHDVDSFLPDFCCKSENLGALWFLQSFKSELIGGTLYAVLANVAFSLTCFQLIMCPCVQKANKRRRRCGEIAGTLFFAAIAFLTFWYSAPFFRTMYLSNRLWHTIYFFISTKMVSWCGASIFNVFIFCLLFCVQCPRLDGGHRRWLDAPTELGAPDPRCWLIKAVNPRFNVLAIEYRNWVRKVQGEGEGVPRVVSMQESPVHSSASMRGTSDVVP